ncbi:response regulator [Paenibacillus sp. CC-CFT747]|nr:response regulator [Paenibacillus sp. CC-CFT747]
MRSILIVDDEPFIVNGLAGMIKEADFKDLEVYKACSAAEAIDWFERAVMDIVVTDISMPGMDGLELQQQILKHWPRCKVIFLTGHNDFNYIKQAIHYRAIDYILKTEGDQAIRIAVGKALKELEREIEAEVLVGRARLQLHAALPLLQNEFLYELLHGELNSKVLVQDQINDLNLPLRECLPVLLLIGKVDTGLDMDSFNKMLILYAIQNIAEEYMSPSVALHSFTYDKSKVVWLIQPKCQEEIKETRRWHRMILGMVERIQQTCKELLKVTLSFAVAGEFSAWTLIPDQFERLQRLMRKSLGMGHELLLVDEDTRPYSVTPSLDVQLRRIDQYTLRLLKCLESNNKKEFVQELSNLMNNDNAFTDPDLRLAISFQLFSMAMTYVTKEGLWNTLKESVDLDRLLKLDYHSNWEDTLNDLALIGEAIFSLKEGSVERQERSLVNKIKLHIEQHLADDLSLTRIGELVSLNPFYLSRLYSQLAGESLTETIMNARLVEAKRQLKVSNSKIQDIATKVGFESASYFTRFLKKQPGIRRKNTGS